jgi:hypothetical protein
MGFLLCVGLAHSDVWQIWRLNDGAVFIFSVLAVEPMKEKRNLLRASIGIVIFCFLFIGIERLFFSVMINPNVTPTNMIYEKKQKIDIAFMGSSQIFSTFDALFLSKIFGKRFYIFAVPRGPIDVFLEELKIILKYQKPQIIIIGADSLLRPTMQDKELNIEWSVGRAMVIIDSINSYGDKIKFASAILSPSDILMGLFQILRQTNIWLRWVFLKLKIVHPELFASEIYPRDSFASPRMRQLIKNQRGSFAYYYLSNNIMNAYGNAPYDRIALRNGTDFHELFKQEKSFSAEKNVIKKNFVALKEIADICKNNDIRLWIVQSPSIMFSSMEVEYIREQIQEYNVEYFDNLKRDIDIICLTCGFRIS